jgi:hypothetical protein
MKPPKLTSVESSNIDAMGHSKDGLFVRFKGGGLYRYPECPKSVYDEGLKAESVGKWFRSEIVGTYKHSQIDG